jgi:hypothetical protein
MLTLFSPVTLLVRAYRALRRRPPLKRPDTYCPMLAEARQLNRAGYHTAAIFTARVALERALSAAVQQRPDFERRRGRPPGITAMAQFLRAVGALDRKTVKVVDGFSERANKVCHGSPVSRGRARSIIRQGMTAVAAVRKAVVA